MVFLLGLCLWLPATTAHAACTSPDLPEGALFYNEDQNVPQLCSDGSWVALGALNPAAGSGVCSDPVSPEGSIFYNDSHDVLQYCDGEEWRVLGGKTAGGGGGGGCSEGGLAMGGYCWYFGGAGQSCTTVCSSRGGYHQATRDFAGSSAANCTAIFDAFMAGLGGPVHEEDNCPSGLGCTFTPGGAARCTFPQTTQGASHPDTFRICACQN